MVYTCMTAVKTRLSFSNYKFIRIFGIQN